MDKRRYRVLGIDPGLTRMGFGLVEEQGSVLTHVDSGVIETDPGLAVSDRLAIIFSKLNVIVQTHCPSSVAIERVFLNLNRRTAVGAIQAAGVAQLVAGGAQLQVHEYSAAQVKQSVVGVGGATKEQVSFMVDRLLRSSGQLGQSKFPDGTDALAIAITHLNNRGFARLKQVAG
ncbi:MAG: crossover junction endodeoxyribonuclease RuvC [Actinomycetota bacterium]